MGRVVPDVGGSEIREIMFRGHRVVYRVVPYQARASIMLANNAVSEEP